MSAFVVSTVHIDLIVSAIYDGTSDGITFAKPNDPRTTLGKMLLLTNEQSVQYRYSHNPRVKEMVGNASESYVHHEHPYQLTRNQLLGAIECLMYQSCEHTAAWEKSLARKILLAVKDRLTRAGVEESHSEGWTWDLSDVAIAYARNDDEGRGFIHAIEHGDVAATFPFCDWLEGRGVIPTANEPGIAEDIAYMLAGVYRDKFREMFGHATA